MLTARRVVPAVALAVVVAVVVAVWLGVRAQVRLTEQGGALSGVFVPTTGVELDERLLYGVPAGVTSMVAVDASEAEAVAVRYWRNDGPVAVTLVAPAAGGTYDPWPADLIPDAAAGRALVEPFTTAGSRRVTVRPGETVGVRLTLDDPCLPADMPMGPTAVVLDATALGVTRQITLPLDPVPLMMSTTEPPASCG
jgi:hypothetical protein